MKHKDLKPESVFRNFQKVCLIPRPSKHEEAMIRFLEDFATRLNLESTTDSAGNVLIRKPASSGLEQAPVTILQAHMDMVCDKEADVRHDFLKDPIQTRISDGWMMAQGTTLGADNGIGVAAMLSVLEDRDLLHGPLECLFTRDEETGLTGAIQLSRDLLRGKYLLNLDSEDEGEIYIGCAGGCDTVGTMRFQPSPVPRDWYHCAITVTGLQGGHSGDEIHKGRGNAIRILFRLLEEASRHSQMVLTDIEGGHLRNAIPHTARASIAVPMAQRHQVRQDVNILTSQIQEELHGSDSGLEVTLASAQQKDTCMPQEAFSRLLDLIFCLPHGVMAMSQDIEGLVETSTNLAVIRQSPEGLIRIATSQRSSLESAREFTARRIEHAFHALGLESVRSDGYPGWKPDPSSRLLALACQAYEDLFHQKAKVKAIHAGLECGLFLEKYPGLDMISFGPTLRDVHTPKERMNLASVERFWAHLTEILRLIGHQKA